MGDRVSLIQRIEFVSMTTGIIYSHPVKVGIYYYVNLFECLFW